MKTFIKAFFIIIIAFTIIYTLGPRKQSAQFKPELTTAPNINELQKYVELKEQAHRLKKGNEAEIIWADSTHQQTDYAIIYLHGFSASKQEGNPVHMNLAKSVKANLYLARLADHGIDTVAPMQYFTADKLWESAKEAYAIGKQLGKKVIIVGTSTGGSLALQLAATYPEVAGVILLSPNIAIKGAGVKLLNDPWGLQLARLISGGKERVIKGKSEEYRKYWYTNYRLEAVVQLEEYVEKAMIKSIFKKVKQPTLLLYYYKNKKEQDDVVQVEPMLSMFNSLGTKASLKEKHAIPNAGAHVIGSYITSKDFVSVENIMLKFYQKHFASN